MVTVRAARWHACGPEHSCLCMGIVETLKKCCVDGFGQISFTQGAVNNSRNCSLPALFLLSRAGLPHSVFWDQLSSLPWDLLVFYPASLGKFLAYMRPAIPKVWRNVLQCGWVMWWELLCLFQTSQLVIALLSLGQGRTCSFELSAGFWRACFVRGHT